MEATAPLCRTVRVDLDLPVPDIAMGGAHLLHVSAFARGRLVGLDVIPAPLDPFPGALLADELARRFGERLLRVRTGLGELPAAYATPVTATVLVCTRNRPDGLATCLRALGGLEHPVLEIVVVDNAAEPDDRARSLVEAAGFVYVHEPVAGLSRARNHGVSVARGEVILFTDDDAQVHPGWAGALLACFEDPLVMAAGGLVLPERLDTHARLSFERWAGFSRGLERFVVDGTALSPFRAARVGAGASMAIRTSFLRSIGGFPEELGTGVPTGSAEDHYAFYRVLAKGFRAVYEPAALASHTHRGDEGAVESVLRTYATGAAAYLLHAARHDRDVGAATAGLATYGRWFGGRALASALRRPGALPPRYARAEREGLLVAVRAYEHASRAARANEPLVRPEPLDTDLTWLRPAPSPVEVVDELPSVSVVIPTRGRREEVVRLLAALDVLPYAEDRVELVVAADGDLDGTVAAVRALGLRRPLRVAALAAPGDSPDHGNGAGIARNHGAAAATGDVLLFLDDDVRPLGPELLVAHGHAHRNGPAVVAGPCPPDVWDADGLFAQQVRNWGVDHARRLLRAERLGFSDVSTGNLSIPRMTFTALGGFAAMPRREDWEFGYRVVQAGIAVRAAPGAAVTHRADVRVPNGVRDRHREGAGDLLFARAHPEVLAWLPLAWWYDMRRSTRLAVSALWREPRRYDRLVALGLRALPALERAGLREEYVGVLGVLNILSYWSGVAETIGGERAWHELLATAREAAPLPAVLDLADDGWEPPIAGTAAEVEVIYGGLALGRAPVRWGRLPWTASAFLRAVAHHFADDLVRAEVRGAVGVP